MTTTAKTGIILVIILVIIVLGWVWYNNSQPKLEETTPVAVVQVPTPTPRIPNTVGTGLSAEGDTSTTALQNDIDALGKQMEFLTTDSANIDQGISSVAK